MITFIVILSIMIVAAIIYLLVKKLSETRLTSEQSKTSSLSEIDSSLPASPEPFFVYVEELTCELSPDGVDLWKRLLTMKLGDKKGARNLVILERKYKPDASIEELIQAAIDRWIEDNNRR